MIAGLSRVPATHGVGVYCMSSMIVVYQEGSDFYKNITNLVVVLDDNNPDECATRI